MNTHTHYRQHTRFKERIRDKFSHRCQLCGGYGDQVDHVIPHAISHDSSEANLRVLCRACNLKTRRERYDAAMPADQWYAWLKGQLVVRA